MKSVPGPRRVVVSFQFVGFGEELVIWTEGGTGCCLVAEPNVIDDRFSLLFFPNCERDDDDRLWNLVAFEKEGSRERRRWCLAWEWDWGPLGGPGEKNRSSVCQRGVSNSSEPWLARIVSQYVDTLFAVRNSWTKSRKENNRFTIEPLTVAWAQVWNEEGRLSAFRGRRGPQYVHDEVALSVISSSVDREDC
jgi:hypothetical protein